MSEPDYETLAKEAGWTFSYGQNNRLKYFRHPKAHEFKRLPNGKYACERADGALDPEYIMADSAKHACEIDNLT